MFLFSGGQRRGAIVLLSFMSLFAVYFYLNSLLISPELPPLVFEKLEFSKEELKDKIKAEEKSNVILSSNNPNKWKNSDWINLGFSSRQIKTIEKYKNKIGGFYSLDELSRCHVISSDKINDIKKFIVFDKPKLEFPNEKSMFTLVHVDSVPNYKLNLVFDTLYYKKQNNKYCYYIDESFDFDKLINNNSIDSFKNLGSFSFNKKDLIPIINKNKNPQIIPFEINNADEVQLSKIKGIGPVFSKRIINYRKSLGGFTSVIQLKEVYGVSNELYDELLTKIKVDPKSVETININKISAEKLVKHPYFNWNLANAIVNYRFQHGLFDSKLNIKKIHLVNDKIYRKIAPYITIS